MGTDNVYFIMKIMMAKLASMSLDLRQIGVLISSACVHIVILSLWRWSKQRNGGAALAAETKSRIARKNRGWGSGRRDDSSPCCSSSTITRHNYGRLQYVTQD